MIKPKFRMALLGLGAIAYSGTCLYLHINQRQFLYDPRTELRRSPSDEKFGLPFEELLIPASETENLHGWWIPAPKRDRPFITLPKEPYNVVQSPTTVLYFYGRAWNKSASTSLHRVTALHQLGFSVLMIDYRGFGASDGDAPTEAQMYQDSELAWQYLTQQRQILPQDIIIYGSSMGGAVAIDLASQHADAQGLIVQSSFTSMTKAVRQNSLFYALPLELILTDKFDSLSKAKTLTLPILFLHGMDDVIVSSHMSEQLYAAVPGPKQIHLIPGAGHFRLYKPGQDSYLKAISKFLSITKQRPAAQRSEQQVFWLPSGVSELASPAASLGSLQ